MRKSIFSRVYAFIIIAAILAISFSPQMQSYFLLPTNQRLSVGDEFNLPLVFPKKIVNNLKMQIHDESGLIESLNLSGAKEFNRSGKYTAKLSLFGLIPLKEIVVDVVPEIKVYPSGHSIGVFLRAQGVMVVGFSPVTNDVGMEVQPARDQGIQIGDIISKINNQPVGSDKELAELIDKYGSSDKQITLQVIRNGLKMDFYLEPIKCGDTDRYRIGLYVRDTAAGIGTLTFFEPDKGKYGALGHVIANVDIKEELKDGMGRIMSASIQKINQGKKGFPGEKIGSFSSNSSLSGVIMKNCNLGIYGVLDKIPTNTYYSEPIPVAYANQITPGTAHILTVLEGDKIEKFEIEIERVISHQRPNGKGLVIKVTDKKLIEKTGGIIQGMSGSPIIQNGKLIGAVTHVFVQEPTRGYGILAEWMIEEIGIIPEELVTDSVLSAS
ncbi:SpoIVB peptidase [Desulfitibacter alkalitolerans]|uniref:SpoIVB peptidase n=1 Tax=Desulfitibacter alkalitolerans TaxID=264641 RepID=UPI00068847A2|nr:SpoIVB peptidase [Desulfitibacter alkalitolerans]